MRVQVLDSCIYMVENHNLTEPNTLSSYIYIYSAFLMVTDNIWVPARNALYISWVTICNNYKVETTQTEHQ